MDKVFLDKYHQELKFFRDASKAFAEEHPKAATRLGLAAPEIEDPYVERLIEAVSFLTARVNLKIDAEYPNFVQHILKVIHPVLTQSIPSAGIVEFFSEQNKTIKIPRLAQVSTFDHAKGSATCEFSLCNGLQIVPFNIEKLSYSHEVSHILSNKLNNKKSKSVLNFNLHIPAGFSFDKLNYDEMRWHINASDLKVSSELMYFLAEKTEFIRAEIEGLDAWNYQFKPELNFVGFDEYLTFYNQRSSNHLKHILEYAILPEKYLFFKIKNLSSLFQDIFKKNKDVIVINDTDHSIVNPLIIKFSYVFNDTSDLLDRFLDEDALNLNCMIINNAFKKRARIIVDQFKNEQHVVMDKLRPIDFEVLQIDRIEGYSKLNHKVKVFEPIYKLDNDTDHFDDSSYGFFSETHQQSQMSSKKNSYKGSECYVLLTNQLKSIVEDDLNQLSVSAWCSNRSLPSEISWTLDKDLKMSNDTYKIRKLKRKTSFTQPISAPFESSSLWRLMNLVTSNFVPLSLSDSQALTQQIKNNLYIFYEITSNVSFRTQINAIQNIKATNVRKVKRVEQHLTAVSGLNFEIIIDEMLMSHVHPYLWGRVLLEYFKSFAPINHFVEICLKNKNNAVIADFTSF